MTSHNRRTPALNVQSVNIWFPSYMSANGLITTYEYLMQGCHMNWLVQIEEDEFRSQQSPPLIRSRARLHSVSCVIWICLSHNLTLKSLDPATMLRPRTIGWIYCRSVLFLTTWWIYVIPNRRWTTLNLCAQSNRFGIDCMQLEILLIDSGVNHLPYVPQVQPVIKSCRPFN